MHQAYLELFQILRNQRTLVLFLQPYLMYFVVAVTDCGDLKNNKYSLVGWGRGSIVLTQEAQRTKSIISLFQKNILICVKTKTRKVNLYVSADELQLLIIFNDLLRFFVRLCVCAVFGLPVATLLGTRLRGKVVT